VNRTIHDVPRFPTERSLTFDTPHLVTPINLGNAGATFGTRLGLFANHAHRRDIVLFTFVSFFLDQQTSGTGMFFTQTALILGRKIPLTVFRLTIHEKLTFFFDHIVVSHEHTTLLNLVVVPNGLTHITTVFDTNTIDGWTITHM
jgi:hypothetical protein